MPSQSQTTLCSVVQAMNLTGGALGEVEVERLGRVVAVVVDEDLRRRITHAIPDGDAVAVGRPVVDGEDVAFVVEPNLPDGRTAGVHVIGAVGSGLGGAGGHHHPEAEDCGSEADDELPTMLHTHLTLWYRPRDDRADWHASWQSQSNAVNIRKDDLPLAFSG
ncbi:hypothetical protein ACU686_11190 [Yinghuangia aomiensis]